MAALRTRGSCCLHMGALFKTCLLLLIVFHETNSVAGQLPRVDPQDPNIIIWGDLPPIPTSGNETRTLPSRPGTLAQMAEGFVDLVQPQGLPLDYITFALENTFNDSSTYYDDNWQSEIWTIMGLIVGIIICLIFGILYIIIVPPTGMIFGCCRCCDRCGGKRVQRESKHMGCKQVTLSLVFFAITGIMCAGMAFTNVSNEFIQTSVDESKITAETFLGNIEIYINGANGQIDYMVETEYDFVDQLLTNSLENIGTEIGGPVEEYILNEAGLQDVITSISSVDATLNTLENSLMEIETLRETLINQSSVLENELNEVADNLIAINAECGNCIENVDQLTVPTNYSQLPSLESQIAGVQEASEMVANITTEINGVLADIPVQITEQTEVPVQNALVQLADAEQQINGSFTEVSEALTNVASELSNFQQIVDDSWDDVEVYSQYIYYGLIGLTCTVLLIVMFNLIGLTMGTFSYKNVQPTERSRMSNAGGNVLIAGVFFTFLLAPFLMLLTLVFFGGMSFATLTCEPLRTYQLWNATIDQPDLIVDGYYLGDMLYDNSSIPLTVSGILTECKKDASAYSALLLDSQFDFDSIKKQLDQLEEEVQKVIDEIKPADIDYDFPFPDFTDDLDKLRDTTDLGNINYTEFNELLSESITGLDLNEYAANLTELSVTVPVQTWEANITAQAVALQEIQTSIVDPMQANVMSIQTGLDNIEQLGILLERQINDTLANITLAEDLISSNATSEAIFNISAAYGSRLVDYGFQFYYQIEHQVTNDFAKCKLLSSTYDSTLQSTCDYPIAALNTFWFTVGWCVFFYVLSIIFAVKLAKYYRIMDDEAPYRAPKKSKKKKKNQSDSDEEMPMDDMEGTTGPDNIRLVDNGRPTGMVPQQNPHYVQDEPILAYNDLGRPMAPPPAYNPGYPKGAPPNLPPVDTGYRASGYGGNGYGDNGYGGSGNGGGGSRPNSGYYEQVPMRINVNSPPPNQGGGNRNSVDMYQYNKRHSNQPF